MADNGVYEFKENDDRDAIGVSLRTLSEAWSKKNVAPDPNWFVGKSDYWSRLGQNLNTPQSLWQLLKNWSINALPGAGVGAAAGAGVGSIIPGVGTAIGAITGFFVGAAASAITQPVTAFVNWVGGRANQVQSFVQDAAVTLIGVSAFALAAKNGLGSALGMILNQSDFLYDFNFDVPDSQIWQQIKSLIDGLYGSAGDFLGSSFARLLLIGSLEPPKIEVDVRGLALTYSEFAEDKREDLLSGVSAFAYQGVIVSQRVAFLFAFMRGRQAFRDFVLKTPDIEKNYPDIYKFAKDWGDEEDPRTQEKEVQDWRVSTWVENKFEAIKKTYGQQIGSFVENFFEGFTDEIRDILEDYIVYKFV